MIKKIKFLILLAVCMRLLLSCDLEFCNPFIDTNLISKKVNDSSTVDDTDLNIYVSDTNGNDLYPGTKIQPKKTIQAGINVAIVPIEVRVAQGTYSITTQINMKDKISLMGGYSSDFSTRNSATYTTTITNTSANCIIFCNAISNNTVIDGFSLIAGNITTICISNNTASPTISNNIITSSNNGTNFGAINNIQSNPIIINNTITAGSNGNQIFGIWNTQSNPTIINNTISGGTTSNNSIGISNGGSSPIIINNTIYGGSGNINSYGILNNSSSNPTITNNLIFTSGTGSRYGIYEYDSSSDPAIVRNNSIFDCTTALYYEEGTANITNLTTNITTGEGMQNLGYWGNTNEGSTAVFVDYAGGNWHLLGTAPLNVRGGGLVAIGITTDKDGAARTTSTPAGMGNSDAAGWSIGAYEKD